MSDDEAAQLRRKYSIALHSNHALLNAAPQRRRSRGSLTHFWNGFSKTVADICCRVVGAAPKVAPRTAAPEPSRRMRKTALVTMLALVISLAAPSFFGSLASPSAGLGLQLSMLAQPSIDNSACIGLVLPPLDKSTGGCLVLPPTDNSARPSLLEQSVVDTSAYAVPDASTYVLVHPVVTCADSTSGPSSENRASAHKFGLATHLLSVAEHCSHSYSCGATTLSIATRPASHCAPPRHRALATVAAPHRHRSAKPPHSSPLSRTRLLRRALTGCPRSSAHPATARSSHAATS